VTDAAAVAHPAADELIAEFAELERGAGSPGEEVAAWRLRAHFERLGCEATVDEEQYDDGYARLHAALSGAGALAGLAAVTGRGRGLAVLAGAGAAAAIADDCANWSRFARRMIGRRRTTWNVVAEAGDARADRTLVLMAHHDAAPTGYVFDDTAQRKAHEALPDVIEAIDTALPLWWPVIAGPALSALGAATGRRGPAWAGLGLSAASAASFADIARHRIVPGANDNLSGVAVLVSVAESLRERPVEGLRVVLVSCGAEEVLQGGVYGFVERRLKPLDPGRTWVLNVDTVGSPRLIMLEGEGPVVMEDYCGPEFRDLVARVAESAGVELRRGMRARTSTDAVITSHAGYPTATIASMTAWKGLSNYHKHTDTPENVDYATVEAAATLASALVRELAV
jgi:acetylornithine deacetylase/succinyl-diaminopimelate desuccinylase-like protein